MVIWIIENKVINIANCLRIEYTDENNKIVKGERNGYEARVLQHEIDHLAGRLFVDYLSSLKRNMIIKRVQKLKKMGEI